MNTINPNTPDNPIRDYYNHLRKRDKDAIPAMVASARKLSDLLYTCLKTMQPYHYQKPVKGV